MLKLLPSRIGLAKLPAGSLAATKRLMRNPELLAAQIALRSKIFTERLATARRASFHAFAGAPAAGLCKTGALDRIPSRALHP